MRDTTSREWCEQTPRESARIELGSTVSKAALTARARSNDPGENRNCGAGKRGQ